MAFKCTHVMSQIAEYVNRACSGSLADSEGDNFCSSALHLLPALSQQPLPNSSFPSALPPRSHYHQLSPVTPLCEPPLGDTLLLASTVVFSSGFLSWWLLFQPPWPAFSLSPPLVDLSPGPHALTLQCSPGIPSIPTASAGTSLASVYPEPQTLPIHLAMKLLHLAPHSFNK